MKLEHIQAWGFNTIIAYNNQVKHWGIIFWADPTGEHRHTLCKHTLGPSEEAIRRTLMATFDRRIVQYLKDAEPLLKKHKRQDILDNLKLLQSGNAICVMGKLMEADDREFLKERRIPKNKAIGIPDPKK